VPWYPRVRAAVAAALPFLAPTQASNLALLVSALLARRTLCLSELARAYPTPPVRRVAAPRHDLLHRLKRLWRFLDNGRVDPLAVQAAAVPYLVAKLRRGRWIGLAVDWTMFVAVLPDGRRVRYQVLRVAAPVDGRALPLLQLAYDQGRLPTGQGQLEERALAAVLAALPPGRRPVVLADRGFARAAFLEWLQARGVDFVVRVKKGTWLTEPDGRRWKLGGDGLRPGRVRWAPGVRFGLWHSPPRGLRLNVALCWRVPKCRTSRKPPAEPWYLATSLGDAGRAVCWYWRRGWIEQSFKDSKQRFGLDRARVGCPARLSRLVMALTLALAWLTLAALPEVGALPPGWRAHVAQWGAPSLLSLALALLDERRDLPAACLPAAPRPGGYGSGSGAPLTT
jgi:DDE family transposase